MRLRKADGHALRWLREEHWYSQKELAKRAGVSRQTIIEIESGRDTSPRNETLFALARALEVSPDALLEERGDLTRLENDQPAAGTG